MRRFGALLAAALLGGCSGLTTFDGGVAYLEVHPPAVLSIPVGGTAQFTARALDSDRMPLDGITIHWRTPDDTISLDEATGLVTGVKAGTARVQAVVGRNDLVSDFVSITVTAPATGSATP